jgi:hypothetical protein
MQRLKVFLWDELVLVQAVPGFLMCVGWTVMYEIYHEDGSFYTTLMQEILGGEGLFPYFLISAALMAFPVGLILDTVREVVGERWCGIPRARTGREAQPSPVHAWLRSLLPLGRFEDRYALYRHARAALLTPAKASGNLALVLLILLIWFGVKIVRMQGWHIFSLAFIVGTPIVGLVLVVALSVRYAAGLDEFQRLLGQVFAPGPPHPPASLPFAAASSATGIPPAGVEDA